MNMLMFCFLIPLWGADELPQQALTIPFDSCTFSFTPTCVHLLQADKTEHYGYVSLYKVLVGSGCDPDLFRTLMGRNLNSPSTEDRKLANLAIGWSLYEDYMTSSAPDEAIRYFECYFELNGDHSRTIKSLSEKYFDRGEIGQAMSCAFRCDVKKVQKRDKPHAYVRLMYITDNGTKIPDKRTLCHEDSPQDRILAIFTYTYLRNKLRLSPEEIIRKDTQMMQYLKNRGVLEDVNLREEDVIFYWRAYSLTSEERRKYNNQAENLLGKINPAFVPAAERTLAENNPKKVTFAA